MMSKRIPKKTKKQKQVITKSPTPASVSKAEAENQRGIVFAQKDELTKAATCFERAIRFLPNYADAHNHLGIVLARQDKLDKAAEHYQRAIDIKPNDAVAYYNFGIIYQKQGKLEKAAEIFQQAIALNANYPEIHLNLANVFKEQDELDKAIDCCQRALSLNPNYVDAHNNLGEIFREQKQLIEAGNHLQQAIALNPKFGLAYYNLGRVREEQGQTDHALACWKRALQFMKPDDAKSYFKVGYMLKEQGKLTEAIAYYQEALAMEPDLSEAHAELGNTFRDKGLINEAIEHFRRVLEIKPTANVQAALLGALNYSPDHNQAAIFSEHKRFNEEYIPPLAAFKPHLNDRNPQRRLKIGYVSPDFRRHSVTKFIEPVLAHHDHEQYEIFCYYNHAQTDDVTQRLQEYADNWFNCVDMRSDEKLADRIRQDQIDILIDLAGHTTGNRLLVFAKKPAPIQVSYLGYPNTTGLTAIDYRITDAYRDPQETSEPFSSES